MSALKAGGSTSVVYTNKLFHIASDLGVCDSNRVAHRGCIARFGPLRDSDIYKSQILKISVLEPQGS